MGSTNSPPVGYQGQTYTFATLPATAPDGTLLYTSDLGTCVYTAATTSWSVNNPYGDVDTAGAVSQIIAGTNITLSPSGGTGAVTVNASGGSASFTQFTTITANTTLTSSTASVLVNAASGNITVTVPTAVGATYQCFIKRIDNSANTVTVNATSSQTIDGNLTVSIASQYSSITLLSNNANWYIT